MKACLLKQTGPVTDRQLHFTDVADPEPGDGQVLIRILACGVCRTDLHVIEGELDTSRQKMPLIPGHQVVGEITRLGSNSTHDVDELKVGDCVGVAWLHTTCGECPYCRRGDENLCDYAQFTGWTCDGGYAEQMVASRDFIYRIPAGMRPVDTAPLLCAGIIGYRCLRKCAIDDWHGAKLGIYGFGAAGHLAIQIARARGADVFVCTRDERHRALAGELGAAWVGGTVDSPPKHLDAAIIFAPAGEIVPHALRALDRGGTLVCGGIHMSPIPEIEYADLYGERAICSVANNVRADGIEFLQEAARVGVRTTIEPFPLSEANDALIKLKDDAIRGAAVLVP